MKEDKFLLRYLPAAEEDLFMDLLIIRHGQSEADILKELENASNSSIEFWNNSIDDEVWNDA